MLSTKRVFISRIQDEMDNDQFTVALGRVSSMHSQLTCLGILSYYLSIRHEKGIFLSVTRPHSYMQRLLLRERLVVADLAMFDAIELVGGHGTETKCRSQCIAEFIDKVRSTLEQKPDTSFMVMDNLMGLAPFISIEKLIEMVHQVFDFIKTLGGFQLIILLDHDADTSLVKGLENISDKHFEVSPGFFR